MKRKRWEDGNWCLLELDDSLRRGEGFKRAIQKIDNYSWAEINLEERIADFQWSQHNKVSCVLGEQGEMLTCMTLPRLKVCNFLLQEPDSRTFPALQLSRISFFWIKGLPDWEKKKGLQRSASLWVIKTAESHGKCVSDVMKTALLTRCHKLPTHYKGCSLLMRPKVPLCFLMPLS